MNRTTDMKTLSTLILTALIATAACSSSPGEVPDAGSAGAGGALAGASGASGAAGHVGAGGTTGIVALSCGGSGGPVDPTALIDDMEATAPAILMEGGRNGAWWAGGDAVSPGASIVPSGDASAEAIPGGRCGSLHAMHVTGQGFTSWAQVSVSMRYGAIDGGTQGLLPYDAHIRTGLTFWARIGDTSAAQVRLGVSDKYSRPEGGICDATSAATTACYDLFGVDLKPLGTTWTQYQIPFGGLGQRGFGLPEPALDTSSIYTIEFDFYPNEIFDFWIDDISFY
jgi:hypothetical protein